MCSKLERYFLVDRKPDENIRQYIDRKIRPDTPYLSMCTTTVDEIVKYLLENLSSNLQVEEVNVEDIIKDGSLGKSTAVKEKSDIALIIFLNGIPSIKKLSELMPRILSCLTNMILGMVNSSSRVKRIEVKCVTKFSVELILTTDDDSEIEMDLLPALDITKSQSLEDIYQEMESCDEELRQYYFSSLLQRQFEFIKESTEEVKSLIRFMKFWAKVEDVPLRSYFIELFVIFNNPITDQQWEPSYLYARMRACLESLTKCDMLSISSRRSYPFSRYLMNTTLLPREFVFLFVQQQSNTNDSTVSYLLDPANPFMNVAPSPEDAVIVSTKAKELLDNWDRIFAEQK